MLTFYFNVGLQSSGYVPPNYMAQQFDINERMRGILIDWLIEVHKHLYHHLIPQQSDINVTLR